ncbi:site-specific integrase [Maricaulis sp.]|uniref:tyrosine-type recombinase/integrase n=1 Tax=Maricaulis sp. TaxID=1486257 RepID=UPI00260BE9A1|nr:site-specific integrase [Maricaulis sp.]
MLFDLQGRRKYLSPQERDKFIRSSKKMPVAERLFCLLMAYTGCRPSEALEFRKSQIDLDMKAVVLRTLKKRGPEPAYRVVPIPDWMLQELIGFADRMSDDSRIWPWCRTTGWSVVKRAMARAGIVGGHASPKGLRHGFAVFAIQAGVPLNLVQRWLGHASIETTAIYANAIGDEERTIAARLWGDCCSRRSAQSNAPYFIDGP